MLLPFQLTQDSRPGAPASVVPDAAGDVRRGGRFWRGLASALSLLGAVAPMVKAGATPAAPARPLPDPSFGTSHVLRALHERHTSREYSPARLDAQVVADVLWAAGGVNRPATGQRTAPSAHDGRYIDLYVFDADGVSLYEPERHALRPLIAKDLRALTGIQDFAAVAPLTLLFVADERRVKGGVDDETRMLFEAVTVGAMSQNVSVLCAERGLSAGVRADIDRRPLRKALGLAGDQRILMAQSVGHPPSR